MKSARVICMYAGSVLLALPGGLASAQPGGGPGDVGDWVDSGPAWQEHRDTVPDPGECSGMAYDSDLGRMVLFGGRRVNDESFMNGTWIWEGSTWEQLDVGRSPSPRMCPNVAYDPVRHEVVLFGGVNDIHDVTMLSDTWVLRGDRWTRLRPVTSPPPHDIQAMAFDPHSERMILFGGCHYGGGYYNDMWAWDGINWTELHPAESPSKRCASGIAYDPTRDALVLFGGRRWDAGGISRDTWVWEGDTWARVPVAKYPLGRWGESMATFGDGVVVFGGYRRRFDSDQTWILTDDRWQQLMLEPSPSGRHFAAMEWDPVRQQAVMVGGRPADRHSSTWTLDLNKPWDIGQ